MRKKNSGSALIILIGIFIFLGLILLIIPSFFPTVYSITGVIATSSSSEKVPVKPQVIHIKTPAQVKAIYMTQCVAGTPSFRASLVKLVEETELNSIVVDIKDYTGTISFKDPKLQGDDVTGCRVADLRDFVSKLHDKNIYVIGRVTVFQDPYYAKHFPELAVKSKSTGGVWKDKNGLPFVDVGARPYWEHIVDIAKASYELGFDEINFDYIRYPSDGNLRDAIFSWTVGTSTKAEMVEDFFSYLQKNLAGTGIKTSADLFGLTTVAFDDLGIGQVLVDTLPYFDYVAPMVYPSHFASGSNGIKVPAEHPYEIIQYSMASGFARENELKVANGISTSTPSKLRPWLQDFNLGATYTPSMVRAQIKATYDVGLTSWMLWNAGNIYTKSALDP